MIVPTIAWWLVIQLFALAALPLAWRLFGRLPSRGYPLTKALGLLLVSYLLWLGAILHLLPNDIGGIAVAFLAVLAVSIWIGGDGLRRSDGGAGERPLVAWLRDSSTRRLILATEVLFVLVFVAWALFRAYNPEIAGTEKPMEFAFINGVLRSRFFPPQDPWLSGYAISYYYFGYVMLGLLIRLTAVDPAVGFNLGVALWYALVMAGAFGIAYDLVVLGRRTLTDTCTHRQVRCGGRAGNAVSSSEGTVRGIGFGLLGALFVGLIGNLEGLAEIAYHRGLEPLSWLKGRDIKQLPDTPPTGTWDGGFGWWWRASRVIHDRDLLGNSVEVIDEFPFFSFLLGDMHPHVLALPFVLLAIGIGLSLLLGAREWVLDSRDSKTEADRTVGLILTIRERASDLWRMLCDLSGLGAPGVILAALLLGALGFLNTWDFPIYVGLAAAAAGVGLALTNGLTRRVVGRAIGTGIVLAVLGWVLYLPFYLGFQSQLGGVLPNLLFPSRFSQFFVMFGLFLVVVLFLLILLSRDAPGREVRRGFLAALPWTMFVPLLLAAIFLVLLVVLPQGQAFVSQLLDNPAVQSAVGQRSLGQLVGLVVGLRLSNPWTFVVVAVSLSWIGGLLWAMLRSPWGGAPGGEPQRGSPGGGAPGGELETGGLRERERVASADARAADSFVLLMVGGALLLAYIVEFAYLRDLFGSRMNTVFKFYYQAWVMLALASAYGVSRLAGRRVAVWLKAPALALTVLLLAGSLFYPAAAIPSKAGEFLGKPTLDGLAFLRQSSPADVAAIEWIRANLPGDAVVIEASGGSYSAEGAERISMSTGNPTLLGWDFHERQWRGGAYDRLAAGRPEALDRIYRTARSEELVPLLQSWGAQYVLVGALERRKFGLTDAAVVRFDRALRKVYDKDGVRIYAR